MNFTDSEVLMAMSFDRAQRQTVAHGQSLVDAKNSEIALLRSALRAARDELETVRAEQLAVEFQLNRLNKLLDTPLH